jgi:hypothetical protein
MRPRAELPEEVREQLTVEEEGWDGVDGLHLYNLFSYLANMAVDSSVAIIRGGESGLQLEFSSKGSNKSIFTLSGVPTSEFAFGIQISVAKKLFLILKSYPTLTMKQIDNGVVFMTDDVVAIQSVRKVD